MRGVAVTALVATVVALVPAASAHEEYPISQVSIGGARLGLAKADYRRALGPSASPVDHLEGGLVRLTFPRRSTQVYFREGGTKALAIVTWNGGWRDAAGIGPCSPVADLRAAYAGKARPIRQGGAVVAYRLGRLVYAAEGEAVGAVMLAAPSFSVFLALNSEECR